jgi:hypothetical protein
MSKAASHFRENDVKRLVRSVERAGVKIGRVELEGGKVILFPDNGSDKAAAPATESKSELEQWMAKRG